MSAPKKFSMTGGGNSALDKNMIPLSIPEIGEEEIEAVAAVIRRRWLTMGNETAAFEKEFALMTEAASAIAVSNCTVALHLALLAVGVKPGDEVIVPSLTFVATANAVLYCGATPVFADIRGAHDLNIDPADVKAKITDRTRCVVAVHHSGYSADMPLLRKICDEAGIFLLEDAAQAAGAGGDGWRCGSSGDIGCFSLYSTKNITTGEGGMITTNNPELSDRMMLLRSHGMTASVLDRDSGKKFGYDVVDLGYNYRMDELRAAIGRVQLGRLDAANRRRHELTRMYHERLIEFPDLALPFLDAGGQPSCHLLPVILPARLDRNTVAETMRDRGIQTSVHYKPIHLMTYYREVRGCVEGTLPITEDVASRELTLPLFATMTDEQVGLVCDGLAEVCGL
jgi:dTDP-4-amino-4,6-dideoxygalactose transaminase